MLSLCFCYMLLGHCISLVAVLHLDKALRSEFSVLSFLFHQCEKDFLFIFFLALGGTKGGKYTLTNVYNFVTILYYFIWYCVLYMDM